MVSGLVVGAQAADQVFNLGDVCREASPMTVEQADLPLGGEEGVLAQMVPQEFVPKYTASLQP